MAGKQYWKRLSKNFLDLHKEVIDIVSVEVHGYLFAIFPGVFSPAISSDTSWFFQNLLPVVKSKSVLEIGTGTGVIACLAKLNGATKVVATDINPNAVKNAVYNVNKYDLDIRILQGDVYSPILPEEKFDIIFWNHPFNYTESKADQTDDLSLSVFDLQYTSLKKYFYEGRSFLNPGGTLFLGTGSIARINNIKRISEEAQFVANLVAKETVSLSRFQRINMDVRLYAFSPIKSCLAKL